MGFEYMLETGDDERRKQWIHHRVVDNLSIARHHYCATAHDVTYFTSLGLLGTLPRLSLGLEYWTRCLFCHVVAERSFT